MRPEPIRIDPVDLIKHPKDVNDNVVNKSLKKNKSRRNKNKNHIIEKKLKKSEQLIINTKLTNKRSRSRSSSRSNKKSKESKESKDKESKETKKEIKHWEQYGIKPVKELHFESIQLKRTSPLLLEGKMVNRVSASHAVLQRLSPYFGQDKDNRVVKKQQKNTMDELEYLAEKNKNKPILNQLIQENILIRSIE